MLPPIDPKMIGRHSDARPKVHGQRQQEETEAPTPESGPEGSESESESEGGDTDDGSADPDLVDEPADEPTDEPTDEPAGEPTDEPADTSADEASGDPPAASGSVGAATDGEPPDGDLVTASAAGSHHRSPRVVVLDYGSGNVRSAVRMLQRLGAAVELTADPVAALGADGLLVPGVGNFHACAAGLRAVDGPRLIDVRLAGGRPVFGICVGMQVLFDASAEPSVGAPQPGLAQWPGTVTRLPAQVVPHMGWNTVSAPAHSALFAGAGHERFYFVHSYAAQEWTLHPEGAFARVAPLVTWSEHGAPFVAAVENGPLWATQFHPEKSGDAGAALLGNWLQTL